MDIIALRSCFGTLCPLFQRISEVSEETQAATCDHPRHWNFDDPTESQTSMDKWSPLGVTLRNERREEHEMRSFFLMLTITLFFDKLFCNSSCYVKQRLFLKAQTQRRKVDGSPPEFLESNLWLKWSRLSSCLLSLLYFIIYFFVKNVDNNWWIE